jgi:hypothetical protein
VPRAYLVILLGLVVLVPTAAAAPCGDPSALRAELERESRRVTRWNWAWRITYTTLAVGQFAVAASGEADRDTTQSLWVGGAKSSFGALGQWFSTLRVRVPPPTGDPCTDRSQLRLAAERAAFEERKAFWVSHIGGLVINLVGSAIIAERVSFRDGAVSFATGYSVGLLSIYTMPRASWRRTRAAAWTAGVVTGGDRYALVVAGSF